MKQRSPRCPVRFDKEHTYRDLEMWLDLSVHRIVKTLGTVAAVDVFFSLYATIDPWDALPHGHVFDAISRLCHRRKSLSRIGVFSLGGTDRHYAQVSPGPSGRPKPQSNPSAKPLGHECCREDRPPKGLCCCCRVG
ncbi:MAG: hypothetical protein QGI09_06675 [Dehalococcoidia bacterium]|nr:hypothetical protein [Dehalococcoidia bacterium]